MPEICTHALCYGMSRLLVYQFTILVPVRSYLVLGLAGKNPRQVFEPPSRSPARVHQPRLRITQGKPSHLREKSLQISDPDPCWRAVWVAIEEGLQRVRDVQDFIVVHGQTKWLPVY